MSFVPRWSGYTPINDHLIMLKATILQVSLSHPRKNKQDFSWHSCLFYFLIEEVFLVQRKSTSWVFSSVLYFWLLKQTVEVCWNLLVYYLGLKSAIIFWLHSITSRIFFWLIHGVGRVALLGTADRITLDFFKEILKFK